jgi:hypothetical protein
MALARPLTKAQQAATTSSSSTSTRSSALTLGDTAAKSAEARQIGEFMGRVMAAQGGA